MNTGTFVSSFQKKLRFPSLRVKQQRRKIFYYGAPIKFSSSNIIVHAYVLTGVSAHFMLIQFSQGILPIIKPMLDKAVQLALQKYKQAFTLC